MGNLDNNLSKSWVCSWSVAVLNWTSTDSLASKSSYEWLQFNDEKKEGTFISAPERIQIPEDIKEQLIVELYSK